MVGEIFRRARGMGEGTDGGFGGSGVVNMRNEIVALRELGSGEDAGRRNHRSDGETSWEWFGRGLDWQFCKVRGWLRMSVDGRVGCRVQGGGWCALFRDSAAVWGAGVDLFALSKVGLETLALVAGTAEN